MPDQNSNRITSMLQDLQAQRSNPPTNLPTPRTPPAPMPGAAVPPQPTMPPPAPRQPIAPPTPPVPPVPPVPPPAPQAPVKKPVDYTSELRTMSADIGNLKVGQAPTGIKPTPVVPAAPSAPTIPAPAIAVPPVTPRGISRALLYSIAGIVVIGIGYVIVSMMGGNGEQVITPTPSPSASATLLPNARSLASYFGTPSLSINLENPSDGTADLLNGLVSVTLNAQQATVISIQHMGASAAPADFLQDTIGTIPTGLSTTFGSDWRAIVYGQTEHFDATGAKSSDTTVQNRLALVIELTDASGANQAMHAWETSGLASAFEPLFQYETAKLLVSGFSDSAYRQIPIRYQNFPHADKSLDYGIVSATNNKNYLVITASRESLFFVIDQLMQ